MDVRVCVCVCVRDFGGVPKEVNDFLWSYNKLYHILPDESIEELKTKAGSDLFILYMGGKSYRQNEDSS